MKKNKCIGLIIGLSSLIAAFLHVENLTLIEAAGPAAPYTDMVLAPGVNIVNSTGSNTEIPGDYGSMFKITRDISYEPIGETSTVNLASSSKVYRFNPATTASQKGVYIKNIGLYNGKSVDMKLVIDKMDFAETKAGSEVYPSFNFIAVSYQDKDKSDSFPIPAIKKYEDMFLFTGSTSNTTYAFSDKYSIGDKVEYHYEFYDHASGAPLNYKGTWNFNNINGLKAVTTDFEGDFNSMYVLSDTFIGYLENKPGSIELYGTGSSVNNERSYLTDLFAGTSYKTSVEKRTPTVTSTAAAPMAIMYSSRSLARIAPATPIVYGEKNSAVHTDGNYLNLNYSILQTIADNKLENRNSTFELKTEVPSFYTIDISAVKVFEYGTDTEWTKLFNVALDPNNSSKAILTAIDPTSEEFNGKVFDIKVTAKPNATFEFDKDAYGYQIGGADDGYMNFELGGPTTSAHYTYKNLFENTLFSEVVKDQSKAKVLYEGVPNADPKKGITFAKGTDLSSIATQKTAYLANIRVDTGNPSDEPVTVSYKNGVGPNSSVVGTQKIIVVLTTPKGVSVEKEVEITIADVLANLKIEFVDGNNIAVHAPINLTNYNVGDTVDLTSITSITDAIKTLTDEGRVVTRPTGETNFNVINSDMTVTYIFSDIPTPPGQLILSSAPAVIDFGVLTYDAKTKRVDNPQFNEALEVKDTRGAVTDGWYLTATLTEEMKNGEGKILDNALRYHKGTDDKILDASAQIIFESQDKLPGTYNISNTWGTTQDSEGIKLQLNGNADVYSGNYTGTILWKVMPGQP